MSVRRRIASLAIMAAVALPLVVGCQFLVFKVCVKNNTDYYLTGFASKSAGAPTYPASAISDVAPGGSGSTGGYTAGAYDFRAKFDVADDAVCEDTVELLGVEIQNTNICISYEVQAIPGKGSCTDEIYATVDYVL